MKKRYNYWRINEKVRLEGKLLWTRLTLARALGENGTGVTCTSGTYPAARKRAVR